MTATAHVPVYYRNVLIPAAVKALPRTRSGIPIPYTTLSHGPNNEDLTRLTTANNGDRVLACACTLGEGLPKLGKPCPHRQRQAMTYGRCVVCGKRLLGNHLMVFLGVGLSDIAPYGPDTYTSIEPPAHGRCAAFSALTCPRLMSNPEDVTVAVSRQYETRKLVAVGFDDGTPRRVVEPMNKLITYGAVDLYTAIPHPERTRFMTLERWLRVEAPAPYRTHRHHDEEL